MAIPMIFPGYGRPQEAKEPDYLSALTKGIELGYKPRNLENSAESSELSNIINAAKAKYAPEMELAGLKQKQGELSLLPFRQQLLQAQSDRQQQLAQDPYGGHVPSGAAGEIYWRDKLAKSFGEDSAQVKALDRAIENQNKYKESIANRREALTNSMAFHSLPSDEKQRAIATAVGMGLDPIEASSRLNNGQTLEEIAHEKNVALNDVQPVFPLSGETRKNLLKRTAFVREIKSLEDNINDATEGFGRRIAGFSPEQIISAIKNNDPERQGKFLAANALQPELNGVRLNAMSGRVGIEAMKHMEEAAHTKVKVFEPLISDESRKYMNQYISKWIGEAINKFSTAELESASLGKGAQLKSKVNEGFKKAGKPSPNKEAPAGSIGLYKDGELYFIPPEKVDEALSEGFSYGQ